MDLTLVRKPAAATPPYVAGQPLVDCTAPQDRRSRGQLDRHGHRVHRLLTPSRTPWTPRIQGTELKNQLLLKEGLEAQGFVNYDKEWWHFTYQPEPHPDTY